MNPPFVPLGKAGRLLSMIYNGLSKGGRGQLRPR